LPPLTISTAGGTGRTAPDRTAAVVAAPDGSTATWAWRQRNCTASSRASSSTRATPASRSRCAARCAKGIAPTVSVISPSAMLAVRSSRTGRPVSSARASLGAPAGSTPHTVARLPPAARPVTTPAINPPPPTGTTTVRASGSASAISSPTVACPATISGWSNGGTTARRSRAAICSAARWRSSDVRPARTTSPPHRFTPATFTAGAVSGITTTARTPTSCAAYATAWP